VAKPGHSEHQLGTAVDVAGADDETVLKTEFGDTPAGKWLTAHAPAFGFAISYTAANRATTGYIPEPWHYRYVGSAARARHEAALAGR
jgi:D-alanyl-D-alanine carboxypeptidase